MFASCACCFDCAFLKSSICTMMRTWGAALTARFGHPFVFSVSTIVFFDTDLCQAKGLAHWSVLVGEVKLLSWM